MDVLEQQSPLDRWVRLGMLAVLLILVGGILVGVGGELRSQIKKFTPAALPTSNAADGHGGGGGNPGKAPSFDNVGTEKAKVVLDVFLNYSNSCQWGNAVQATAAGRALPDKIRVVYHDTSAPETADLSKKFGVGCQAQLVINGSKKLSWKNKEGQVTETELHGPMAGDPGMFLDVLRYNLRKQYGPKFSEADSAKLGKDVAAASGTGGKSADGASCSDGGCGK